MPSVPQLQLALDYVSLPPAIVMAERVAPHVDVIEIGTPLCKAAGVQAIRAIREVCPRNKILADFKTPDAGGIEAGMAFDAGADLITVMAAATLFTVASAQEAAHKQGKEIAIELTGVREMPKEAREWKRIGIERVVCHRGWDEQESGQGWSNRDLDLMELFVREGFKVSLAGGITLDSLRDFAHIPISIVVVGKAIRGAPDPAAAAAEFQQIMAQAWRA